MVREIVAEIEEGGPGSGPHSDDDNPFDREPSDAEMADIEKEFESTVQTLLRTVDSDQLLSDNTKLSLSLSRRQPYLDPLNYIQVMLLKAHREIPDEDTVNLDPLLRTIHAIATGMKNTG